VGVAPFYIQTIDLPIRFSVLRVKSFRVRALQLLGEGIIWRSGADATPLFDDLYAAIRAHRAAFDLISIPSQRLEDPHWHYLQSGGARRLGFQVIRASARIELLHRLDFVGTFEAYQAAARAKPGFPGKSLRRYWRDMKDRSVLTRISRPEQVPGFLDDVDRVYRASWQGRTYGGPPRNSAAEVQRLETMAALGYLRSYTLVEDQRAIAFILGYQYRNQYFYEETSFDSDRSAVSPGSILTFGAIEDLFRAETPARLSFGFGDAAYKRTFGNASEEACSLYLVLPGRWRWILRAQRSLNAMYNLAHAAVTRVGLDRRLRKLLKRQR
jgi:hypothetical protein